IRSFLIGCRVILATVYDSPRSRPIRGQYRSSGATQCEVRRKSGEKLQKNHVKLFGNSIWIAPTD
ncbi:hypothetical protein V1477_019718, partial [Vespula maculifrons]